MSRNYYFETTNKGPFKYEDKIHIGQLAGGWEPLFQANRYFTNFKSLVDFYSEEHKYLTIVDEYGVELTWNSFANHFLGWAEKEDKRKREDIDYRDEFGYAWCKREFY